MENELRGTDEFIIIDDHALKGRGYAPRKAELTRKFHSITLPELSDNDNPDAYYSPVLDALTVRTKFELKMLRDIVTEELLRVQERILSKAFQDVLDGKLEEEDFPLRRITTPDGGESITNVSEEFMTIASFMAWLNDKAEE